MTVESAPTPEKVDLAQAFRSGAKGGHDVYERYLWGINGRPPLQEPVHVPQGRGALDLGLWGYQGRHPVTNLTDMRTGLAETLKAALLTGTNSLVRDPVKITAATSKAHPALRLPAAEGVGVEGAGMYHPDIWNALSHILAARLAFQGPAEKFLDHWQNAALDTIRDASHKFGGLEADLEVPTDSAIQEEADRVTAGYQSLMSREEGIIPAKQRAVIVREQAQRLMASMDQHDLSSVRGQLTPNPIEHSIAEYMATLAPSMGPGDLRKILEMIVFQRLQDYASAQIDAQLGMRFDTTLKRFTEMGGKPPTRYFVIDWLSSSVAFSKEEGERLKNIIWGFGSTELWIRQIGSIDVIRIPYEAIQGSGGPVNGEAPEPGQTLYTLNVNYFRYADIMGAYFGVLGRLLTEKEKQQSGGVLRFAAAGRAQDFQIVVRDPERVQNVIYGLTQAARGARSVLTEMETHARQQDTEFKPLIRPAAIKQLLDETIFQAPTVWVGGHRDLDQEIQAIHTTIVEPARDAYRQAYGMFSHRTNPNGELGPHARKKLAIARQQAVAAEKQAIEIVRYRLGYLAGSNNGAQRKP